MLISPPGAHPALQPLSAPGGGRNAFLTPTPDTIHFSKGMPVKRGLSLAAALAALLLGACNGGGQPSGTHSPAGGQHSPTAASQGGHSPVSTPTTPGGHVPASSPTAPAATPTGQATQATMPVETTLATCEVMPTYTGRATNLKEGPIYLVITDEGTGTRYFVDPADPNWQNYKTAFEDMRFQSGGNVPFCSMKGEVAAQGNAPVEKAIDVFPGRTEFMVPLQPGVNVTLRGLGDLPFPLP